MASIATTARLNAGNRRFMFFIISFLLLCFCFCLLQPNHFRPDQRGAAENVEARGEKLKTVLRADRARERPRGGFMPPLENGKSRESDGKQPDRKSTRLNSS